MLTISTNGPLVSSVIKKQTMALTGLLMCGFLLVHLAGNIQLFRGAAAFNQYAHFMLNNPLIMVAEWALALLFAFHAVTGLVLIWENYQARDQAYVVRNTRLKGNSLSLVSMALTGPVLLAFLVLHLVHFRYATGYTTMAGGLEVRDLYRIVVEFYQSPANILFYIAAMLIMALHVQHGFWSAFQSLGVNYPRYSRLLEIASNLYAAIILFGFCAVPISFIEW